MRTYKQLQDDRRKSKLAMQLFRKKGVKDQQKGSIKGRINGIGGIIKHLMWNKIKSRNIIIHDAKKFATEAQKLVKTQ